MHNDSEGANAANIYTVTTEQGFIFPYNCTGFFSDGASITKIDLSNADVTKIVNCEEMFSGNGRVKTVDLSGLNFKNCTSFKNMFKKCLSLETLNTNGTTWAGVKYANGNDPGASFFSMFLQCSKLKTVDLSGFSGSATTLGSMFDGCTSLTSVDISRLKTNKAESFTRMFNNCNSLTELDLVNITTDSVTNTSYMFQGCQNLKTIKVSAIWDLTNVTLSASMFYNCKSLVGAYGFAFDDHYTNKTYARPDTDGTVRGYLTGVPFLDGHTLYLSGTIERNPTLYQNSNVWYIVALPGSVLPADCTELFAYCTNLREIDLSKADGSAVTDMTGMFSYCYTQLTKVDLSGLNVRNCTTMKEMFKDCEKLKEINMNGFNAASVTDISFMFENCRALTSVDFSEFTGTNLKDMSFLFSECWVLTQIDLSPLNTSTVTNMKCLFDDCYKLRAIDLSQLNTQNVTDMSYMFSNCQSFTALNLSALNTAKVQKMTDMFNGCIGLTALDLSSLNTARVTDMSYMFRGCTSLRSINMTGLNTKKVTNMAYMFDRCKALEQLRFEVSTAAVTNMKGMFRYCEKLKVIFVDSAKWNTGKVTESTDMFTECTALTGGNGTVYDKDNTDVSRAVIDGVNKQKGYLSDSMLHTSIMHNCGFNDNLAIYYAFPKAELAGYENLTLTVEREIYEKGASEPTIKKTVLTTYTETTVNGVEMYMFAYRGITSTDMGCAVRAVLTAEKDGVIFQSAVDEYSIQQYAVNRLKKSSDAQYKTMLVDLLNYGAAAQVYFDKNPNHPVNEVLTSAQQQLATQTMPTLKNNTKEIALSGATATFNGKNLSFDNNIVIVYRMKLPENADLSQIKLKLTYKTSSNDSVTKTISGSKFTKDGSYYIAKYDGLAMTDFRSVVSAVVMNGSTAISNTLKYSVESYAFNKLGSSSDENFKTLLREMMKFGVSAETYFS